MLDHLDKHAKNKMYPDSYFTLYTKFNFRYIVNPNRKKKTIHFVGEKNK